MHICKKYCISIVFLFILSGCGNISFPKFVDKSLKYLHIKDNESDEYNKKIDKSDNKTNFHLLVGKMIMPICNVIKENSIIYVTDYVNEKNLKNSSKLGFLLSNESKVALSKCDKNIKIKELQLANKLKLGPTGARMLTRKIKELKIKHLKDNHKILIGTYIITKKQLLIFAKLIDLKTANALKINSISTPLTNEIKELEGIPIEEKNLDNVVYTPMHL